MEPKIVQVNKADPNYKHVRITLEAKSDEERCMLGERVLTYLARNKDSLNESKSHNGTSVKMENVVLTNGCLNKVDRIDYVSSCKLGLILVDGKLRNIDDYRTNGDK